MYQIGFQNLDKTQKFHFYIFNEVKIASMAITSRNG